MPRVTVKMDTGYRELLEQIKQQLGEKEGSVVIGLPAGESGVGGTHPRSLAPILKVATWNEYGTKTSPARPWLGPGSEMAWEEIQKMAAEYLRTSGDIDTFLRNVGTEGANILKDYITNLKEPPNANSTIKRKGADNPLVDTGTLRNTVTYQVRD